MKVNRLLVNAYTYRIQLARDAYAAGPVDWDLEARCPWCNAAPWVKCRIPSGNVANRTHADRRDASLAAHRRVLRGEQRARVVGDQWRMKESA